MMEIISTSFLQSRRLVGITAGGANHRFSKKMRLAPDGAAEVLLFLSVLKNLIDFVTSSR
jgi:hypothetical protein